MVLLIGLIIALIGSPVYSQLFKEFILVAHICFSHRRYLLANPRLLARLTYNASN